MAAARSRACGCGSGSPAGGSTASSLERAAGSEHVGALAPLRRVVSPEPVLSPEVLAAGPGGRRPVRRHAGRRAAAGRAAAPRPGRGRATAPPRRATQPPPDAGGWSALRGRRRVPGRPAGRASPPRAVWSALPGPGWPRRDRPRRRGRARRRPRRAGRACPTTATSTGWTRALTELGGPDRHVVLTAELGPGRALPALAARSRRGRCARCVGTRAAVFAPVARPRPGRAAGTTATTCTPSPARRTRMCASVLRAARRAGGCRRCCIGGFARTAEAQRLVAVRLGAGSVAAPRRRYAPRRRGSRVAGDDAELGRDPAAAAARLPTLGLADRAGRAGRGPGAGPGAARAATCRAWPAPSAAARPAARPAAGRWPAPAAARRRPAAGAAAAPSTWTCPTCDGHAAAGAGGRCPAHRRRARPGLPAASRYAPRGGDAVLATVAGRAGARRRDARRRAGRRGRLRRGPAARRLGAARPPRPARRRGGPAPLDWRAAALVRPAGAGETWCFVVADPRVAARGAGAGALGPRDLRRPRAGRAGCAAPPASRGRRRR